LFLVDNMPSSSSSSPRRKNFTKIEDSNMSQTICLFRKYLLKRSKHNNGKTNMEESQVIKRRTSAHPLLPPKFGCNNLNRPPSLLEQHILPALRYIIFDTIYVTLNLTNFC
jgi:hypothetical protein